MSRLTEQQILDKTADIVAASLRVDRARVTPDAHMMDDLGAESLDIIEITMETESVFNVCIPERSILDTAIDVFGPDVLEKDGYLTSAGKLLLHRRLPDLDRTRFEGQVSIASIRSYFLTVRSWAHMVWRLAQHTPSECLDCASTLIAEPGFRMKCPNCGKEMTLRAGEDLNREWVEHFYKTEYLPSLNNMAGTAAATENPSVP